MTGRGTKTAVSEAQALRTFLELVRIDSPSGHEEAISAHLAAELRSLGMDVKQDASGNLIARREGRGRLAREPYFLLGAHMDTVQPGTGIQPQIENGIIRSDGTTILAADDKAGITAILEGIRSADRHGQDTRPVEVIFTVCEETGLKGAKALDVTELQSKWGAMFDSNGPVGHIVTQGPAQNSLKAVVHGKAAHAGVAPETGVNALVAAARALAEMKLGRIDTETTANIGIIRGGTATNIVPDRVELEGETRSRDPEKLALQSSHMKTRIEEAAQAVGGNAEVRLNREYDSINLSPDSDLVKLLVSAMHACGLTPHLVPTGGGSDANVLNGKGIATVNLGVGFANPHSVDEHLAIADLVQACEVVLAVLTVES
jgi:tripeptide aminopeptidase